jgi:hypothetical protein
MKEQSDTSKKKYTGMEALAYYIKYYSDRNILPPECEGEFTFPDGSTLSHKLMNSLLLSVMDGGEESK